jgi:hypothetical protein
MIRVSVTISSNLDDIERKIKRIAEGICAAVSNKYHADVMARFDKTVQEVMAGNNPPKTLETAAAMSTFAAYRAAGLPAWPALSPVTIAIKKQGNYPLNILKRTGELQKWIFHEQSGSEAAVGITEPGISDIAVEHELGRRRDNIPLLKRSIFLDLLDIHIRALPGRLQAAITNIFRDVFGASAVVSRVIAR